MTVSQQCASPQTSSVFVSWLLICGHFLTCGLPGDSCFSDGIREQVTETNSPGSPHLRTSSEFLGLINIKFIMCAIEVNQT